MAGGGWSYTCAVNRTYPNADPDVVAAVVKDFGFAPTNDPRVFSQNFSDGQMGSVKFEVKVSPVDGGTRVDVTLEVNSRMLDDVIKENEEIILPELLDDIGREIGHGTTAPDEGLDL